MRNAPKLFLIAAMATIAAGCRNSEEADQNIVITNTIPPDAEVEAVPPDESSATPSDELANGVTNDAADGATDPIVNANNAL